VRHTPDAAFDPSPREAMMRVEDQRERLTAPSLLNLATGPIATLAVGVRNLHHLELGAPRRFRVELLVRSFLPKNGDPERRRIVSLLDKIAHHRAEFGIPISRDLDEDPAAARLRCRAVEQGPLRDLHIVFRLGLCPNLSPGPSDPARLILFRQKWRDSGLIGGADGTEPRIQDRSAPRLPPDACITRHMYNYGNISALQTVHERQTDLAVGLGSSARSKVGGFYVSMDACGRDRHIDLRFIISRSGGL
jgi:hypothetical protein